MRAATRERMISIDRGLAATSLALVNQNVYAMAQWLLSGPISLKAPRTDSR